MGSLGAPLLLECPAAATFPQRRLLYCAVRPLSRPLIIGSSTGPSPAADPEKGPRKPKRPPKEKLPRGLRRYETTVVLRPDITEEERLAWTQQYDEAIIAGGAVTVEFSNRGILPLTYSIKKKDMGGVAKTYLDGVYMQIAYLTKPQSQLDLQRRFNRDDDVIRTITMLLK